VEIVSRSCRFGHQDQNNSEKLLSRTNFFSDQWRQVCTWQWPDRSLCVR